MELSPPLLLLFGISQSEVRSKFDALLADSADIVVDGLGQAERSRTTLVCDGVTVVCDWNVGQGNVASRKKIFSTINDDMVRSAMAISLHPHVGDGLKIPAIGKMFLSLGASFARQLSAIAVVWQPSALQTDTDYFVEVVDSYLSGGVFPVLPVVDFEFDDVDNMLRSNGLGLFCGQEFEFRSDQLERPDLVRRAIRLAHDLAINGAVEDEQDVPDIEPESVIHLAPSVDGTVLHCRIKSNAEQIVTLG